MRVMGEVSRAPGRGVPACPWCRARREGELVYLTWLVRANFSAGAPWLVPGAPRLCPPHAAAVLRAGHAGLSDLARGLCLAEVQALEARRLAPQLRAAPCPACSAGALAEALAIQEWRAGLAPRGPLPLRFRRAATPCRVHQGRLCARLPGAAARGWTSRWRGTTAGRSLPALVAWLCGGGPAEAVAGVTLGNDAPAPIGRWLLQEGRTPG